MTATQTADRRVTAVLTDPALRRYLIGQAISVSGTWMQIVALGWLAFDATDSPLAVGAVTAARTIPILVLAVPAGVLGDRVDRRRLIVATSLFGAAVAAALAVLSSLGTLDVTALLVLSAAAGTVHALEVPTYNAYLGQLAGHRIVTAIALNGVVFNAARILGPAVAGVFLATNQTAAVFGLNALSYLALGGLLAASPAVPSVPRAPTDGGAGLALRYVRSEPAVRAVLVLLAVHTLTMSAPVILAAPLAVELGGGAAGTGLLVAGAGAGAIVALLVISRASGRPNHRWLVAAGVTGAIGQVGLAVADGVGLGLVTMALAGGGMVAYTATSNAILQLVVPDQLRARLMSFYGIVIPGIAPLAALLAGAAAVMVGLDQALVAAAAVWLLVLGIGLGTSPGLRGAQGGRLDMYRTRQV
jgi:MFS family permease